jgi:Domain of unknown function (DUF4032)
MIDTMSDRNGMADALGDELLQRSQLFQRWQLMKKEILLHKWYQSEKAGYDIGWERAATNWMIHYGCRRQPATDNSTCQA